MSAAGRDLTLQEVRVHVLRHFGLSEDGDGR